MTRIVPGALALLLLLLPVLDAGVARAADTVLGVSWSVAVPTRDAREWIPSSSFRGVAVEGRWIHGRHSFGVYAGWQVFHDTVAGTVPVPGPGDQPFGADVSGTQFRYRNVFPLLVTAHYYLGDDRRAARAHLGLGAGAYAIEDRLELGVAAFEEDTWHPGVSPEVGLGIPVDWNTRLILSARYHYAFSSGNAEAASWAQFSVGLAGL